LNKISAGSASLQLQTGGFSIFVLRSRDRVGSAFFSRDFRYFPRAFSGTSPDRENGNMFLKPWLALWKSSRLRESGHSRRLSRAGQVNPFSSLVATPRHSEPLEDRVLLAAAISGNDLVIDDTNGVSNSLTISRSGSDLVITDSAETFSTAIPGAVLSDGDHTLTVPVSALGPGGKIIIHGQGGDDSLAIDVSMDLGFDVEFHGGAAGNDSLTITGGAVASVTHSFTNANDGSVTINTGLERVISYTGLEPITDSLSATDRVFTFNGGNETITLTDAPGANMTIDSTLGESVTFANPTGSLTINAGTGTDTVTIASVDADGPFNASLMINGDDGTDTVNLNGDVTLASGNSLSVTAETVNTGASADLITSGAGTISITADDVAIDVTSTLQSASTVSFVTQTAARPIRVGTNVSGSLSLTDAELDRITSGTTQIGDASSGTITVSAGITHGNNLSFTTGGGVTISQAITMAVDKDLTVNSTSTTSAISLNGTDSDISTTGTGAVSITTTRNISLSSGSSITTVNGGITLEGNQQTTPTSGNFSGVQVNAATVQSTGTGSVTVNGRGGDSGLQNAGVRIDNGGAVLGGTAGLVTVVGVGGSSSGNNNEGVLLSGTGTMIGSAGGNVSVTGTAEGSGAASANRGVLVGSNAVLTAGGLGTVTVTGASGTSTGSSNWGVQVTSSGQITSAGGNVTVTGTGRATGTDDSLGVILFSGGTITSGGSGSVTVTGQGSTVATGAGNRGVQVSDTAQITSGGGNVVVDGTGGGSGSSSFNEGVFIVSGGQVTAGGNGSVTVTGQGGNTTGGANHGFYMQDSGAQITSGGGNVSVTGVAGGSSSQGINVSGGAITTADNGGLLTLAGDRMLFSSTAISAPAGGSVTLKTTAPGRTIALGDTDTASQLGLTDAELDQVTAGTIILGDVSGGLITVTASISRAVATDLQLFAGGDNGVTFSGSGSLDAGGGDVTIALNASGTGGVVSGTATTDIIANSLSITAGSGGIGTSGNPLAIAAMTLVTDTDNSADGPQFLRELDSVSIGSADLNAGTAPVTLSGGTFFTGSGNGIVGPVTVASGATLGGTGLTGAVTVQSGGHIAPGTSPGILNSDGVSFASGSNFDVEIDGTTVGTQYDQLNVTGTVSLGNATLNVTLGFTPSNGDSFTIINNDGSDAVTGTFNGLAEGASFMVSGMNFVISYAGGSGNDVVLTVQNDITGPTATIVVAGTSLIVEETSLVTITFSEAVTGFTNADLTVANGSLSAVSSNDGGVTFTATLTPSVSTTDATNVITLDNTGVTDGFGNAGTGTTNSNNYAIDTERPTATIVVADSSLIVGETSLVTITFREAIIGFTNADLSVANGSLSAVSSNDGGVTFTATLTPSASTTDATNVITLDNTGVSDTAGNAGTGTTDSNN